jgi:hypothetical protein
MNLGADYISLASKWLCKKKSEVVNVISSALLRGIWLTRNEFMFNNQGWSHVKLIPRKYGGYHCCGR